MKDIHKPQKIEDFANHLKVHVEHHRGNRSLRQLSEGMGYGFGYLSDTLGSMLKGSNKTGPLFFPMVALANELGTSLDDLAGRPWATQRPTSSQSNALLGRLENALQDEHIEAGRAPSMFALQALYAKSGARLEAFKDVLPFCDLYKPTPHRIEVVHVGQFSLAGIKLKTTNPKTLENALNQSKILGRLLRDQEICQERGYFCTPETLDDDVVDLPIHVRMNYSRAMFFLRDHDGNGFVLVYAVPFSI